MYVSGGELVSSLFCSPVLKPLDLKALIATKKIENTSGLNRVSFYSGLMSSWFYGVMVSTQDSESCDPSSNLGRT